MADVAVEGGPAAELGPTTPGAATHATGDAGTTDAAGTADAPAGRQWPRILAIALGCTVGLRLVSELIMLGSAYGTTFPHIIAKQPSLLIEVWNRWDTGYYTSIAQHGYPAVASGPLPHQIAFAPLYPALMEVVHGITGAGLVASGQLVSAAATVVAVAGVVRLAGLQRLQGLGGSAAMLVVAFPTAFFLLADYPDSLGLAFVAWSFVAVRRRRYLAAGVLAAAAFFTVYYLVLVVPALLVEVWLRRRTTAAAPAPGASRRQQREARRGGWPALAVASAGVALPGLAAVVSWLCWCDATYHRPLAFVQVQSYWTRHLAWPWTLIHRTLSDLFHWRFLDTHTESVMELFDAVTVVLLAVAAVYTYLRVRRSYGVFLGIVVCVFTFQTMLYSETREALALAPFFVGMARWTNGHPWRERAVLALFLPAAYYLIWRFGTGRFAD